jgi:hypothetical protein
MPTEDHTMSTTSDLPDTGELVEGLLFYPIALVISATIAPGLTICIPGLILCAAFVIIPLLAVGLVVAVVAAIVYAPFALVHAVRGLLEHRTEEPSEALVLTATPQH